MVRPKPVVLIILDGYGVALPSKGNAITLARKPNLDSYLSVYPVLTIQAGGEAVGLSWGEVGNSEVGHLGLGSGKIIYQSLPRITRSIADGSFFKNEAFLAALKNVEEKNSQLHLMGLVSPGGVHSYSEHCYALVELAKKHKIKKLFIHAFLDGRDTPHNSAKKYIEQLQKKLQQIGLGEIATLAGRFYAMDSDNNWERIAPAYLAMTEGRSTKVFSDPLAAIEESYKNKIYDEEFVPTVITDSQGKPRGVVKEGDSVIFFQ